MPKFLDESMVNGVIWMIYAADNFISATDQERENNPQLKEDYEAASDSISLLENGYRDPGLKALVLKRAQEHTGLDDPSQARLIR